MTEESGAQPYPLRKPITLDDFTRVCGHFVSDTNVNNGYGCDHPENESKSDRDASMDGEPGVFKCYQFTCPIASAIYRDDPRDVRMMRGYGFKDEEWDDDGQWMQPWR